MKKILNWFRKERLNELEMGQLKKITKVLIIDDENPTEIRDHLKNEGWKVQYLPDLDATSNKKMVEAHVIFLDIMGVGTALGEENGLGLVKRIKEVYPEKKIVIYSSVSKQDIFDEALDYVDKRLRKEASLIPYSSAVEEMAAKSLNWEDSIRYTFGKVRAELEPEITFEEFESLARKSIKGRSMDPKKLQQSLSVSKDVALLIATILKASVSLSSD